MLLVFMWKYGQVATSLVVAGKVLAEGKESFATPDMPVPAWRLTTLFCPANVTGLLIDGPARGTVPTSRSPTRYHAGKGGGEDHIKRRTRGSFLAMPWRNGEFVAGAVELWTSRF